ncbi:MAG: heme exporter protein CcmB, partial [Gemmatimonadota bacterium]|nr:heme exporter protein CcmB [Gemmatimonadota bacterium]
FQGILLSPVPKDAIFLAKALANFVFLYIVALLVVAVFMFFFGLEVGSNFGMLTIVIGLGVLAFVALGTLFTAVSTGTRMGDTLLPVLIFPLLAPVVIYGTTATSQFLANRPVTEAEGSIKMLAAFALMAFFLGSWLFRFVVED